MSALDRTPENLNFLNTYGYQVLIKKLPYVKYFTQKFEHPGCSIPSTSQPNPFTSIPHSGEHILYEPLTVDFKVDEDMKNYIEVYNWLRGLGFPDNFEEHKALTEMPVGERICSDISIIALTNVKNPNIMITYRDAFPVSISRLYFSTTENDVVSLNCQVTFEYTLYDIEDLPVQT